MRRTLFLTAVVAGAFAAPAAAGLFTGFAFAKDCGFRRVCFDVELHRGALAAAAGDRFQLWMSVTYLQDGKKATAETVRVSLPTRAQGSRVVVRADVIIPRDVVGRVTIDASASYVLVLSRRTGDRAFFVDETGVIRATEVTVPPCDDTDDDPANDCPDALEN